MLCMQDDLHANLVADCGLRNSAVLGVGAGGDEGFDPPEPGEQEVPTESQDWGNEKLGPISAMSAGPGGRVMVAFAKGRIEKYTCHGRQEEAISKRACPLPVAQRV